MSKNISLSHFIADYKGLTGDKRLDARAQALWQSLSKNPGSVISRLSADRAGQVAYYRLLENEKLSEQNLIEELTCRVSPLGVRQRYIMCAGYQ